eukprot:151374_1
MSNNPFSGKFGSQFIINMTQQSSHNHHEHSHSHIHHGFPTQFVFQNRSQNGPFEFERPKMDSGALSKYGFRKEDMKEHIIYAKNLHKELTKLVKSQKQLFKYPNLEDLCKNYEGKAAILAAEVYNHNLYFNLLSAYGGDKLFETIQCKDRLANEYDSFNGLKKEFEKVVMEFDGSGWIYLQANKEETYSKLEIIAFKQGENPLKYGHYPLLCIDMFEHAYIGNDKWRSDNAKKKYLNAFWQCIDWRYVDKMYDKAFPRFPAFGMGNFMGGF